ncbi:MAG: PLP-dependent aminotransferase family protein, partial [Desulfurococcales archaeon]|nr:PLP-dependent aminotransferase family protein [Desulfurococcales archaeon]
MKIEYSRFFSSIFDALRASDVRELLKLTERKRIISFAGGLPDPRVFPKDELAEIARQVVEERGEQALQYSPTPGVSEFREELVGFLSRMGVRFREWDEVIVTTGSQEALYLAALSLIDPGDTVFMEEPGYLAAINLFRALRARVVPVPVDGDGMVVEELEERVRRAVSSGERVKLVYVNPTSNNPNGTTMPDERRKALLEVASRYDLLVVEDDPYSYFTFDDAVRFTHIKSMDSEGRVIYLGTFSKILVPGLRLGWAVAPGEVARRIELLKQIVDLHSSTLSQYIALEAIRRGVVKKVIDRAKKVYRRKRDLMLDALEKH